MGEETLSIIVPVYRTDLTLLDRCLDSIDAQAPCRAEPKVLLVADGRDENEPLISSGIAERHKRVEWKVVEHNGVASARNAGLSSVTTDYVMFVDSDDYLPAGAIDKLVPAIRTTGADFVMANHSRVNGEERESVALFAEERKWDQNNLADLMGTVLSPGTDAATVWGKIFRTEFLRGNGLSFNPRLKNGEDQELMVRSVIAAKEVAAIPADVYSYVYNPHSAVREFRETYAAEVEETIVAIRNDLVAGGMLQNCQEAFNAFCLDRVQTVLMNYVFHPDSGFTTSQQKASFQGIRDSENYRDALASNSVNAFPRARKAVLMLVKAGAFRVVRAAVAARQQQKKR